MSKQTRALGWFIIVAGVGGMAYFIAAFATNRMDELMFGLGIELIGAVMTAGVVLALEKVLMPPDEDLTALRKQIDEQNKKIDELQATLKVVVTKLADR